MAADRAMSGPPGQWRKRNSRAGAQPEVEVVGERVAGVVAADRLVDAAVDHPGRVDEVVVAEEERVQQRAGRELAAVPHAGLRPPASMITSRRRGRRRCPGRRSNTSTWRRSRPGRQRSSSPSIAISSPRPVGDERVVGGGDAPVALVADDPQPRLAGEAVRAPRRSRGLVEPSTHDQHLELRR